VNSTGFEMAPLSFPWQTADPFIFCVYHHDVYPPGDGKSGLTPEQLSGRALGNDFEMQNGFRMYHGKHIPGFPGHPHRGFETITVARKGLIDHSDSMGAAGRYGDGDVQWMTAGRGVQHSEMFPLLKTDSHNELELFQIWLNLPARSKMADPSFSMIWAEKLQKVELPDENGKKVYMEVMAGSYRGHETGGVPPNSWAADANNQVAVVLFEMEAGSGFHFEAPGSGLNRRLYFYEGKNLLVNGVNVEQNTVLQQKQDAELNLICGEDSIKFLMLQGRAINEPVVQYGPFVMNTQQEIMQAFEEYRKTEFGGWPWPQYDNIHPQAEGRFAKMPDGSIARPV
jgi:redox-sensitive bicupin YhaK (pirin superfamily)